LVPGQEVNPELPLGFVSGRFEAHKSRPHLHFGIRQGSFRAGKDPRTNKWFYPSYTAIFKNGMVQCNESDPVHAEIISEWEDPTTFLQERFSVIFSNFGPGDAYELFGYSLAAGHPELGDVDQGDIFLSLAERIGFGRGFQLERIELAIGLVSGPNELDVWLMSSIEPGVPGEIIETFHLSGKMASAFTSAPPLVAQSVLRPILTADTEYWLIASVTGPNAEAIWHINLISNLGAHACRMVPPPSSPSSCTPDFGEWGILTLERGAFRIVGTPVP
jgi:hypothetical protein